LAQTTAIATSFDLLTPVRAEIEGIGTLTNPVVAE
jgi:hypothetical protein